MPDEKEKKTRKPKEERSEKEQAFMEAIHFWRKHPYKEAWETVLKLALDFKREKTDNAEAAL